LKPGHGAGLLLYDAQRLTREAIREKWKRGDYGAPGERPRADYVDQWLKFLNK
jgi:hypothetical protein